MTTLTRTLGSDLEIRAGGDGRTVFGLAVPFGQVAEIHEPRSTYREVFVKGAFARTIAERGPKVKLLANHDHKRWPIGRPSVLREDAAGLYMEARVSQTRDGDEALELIRDGALDSFSISFRPVKEHRRSDDVVERTEVALVEVSIVAFPAYEGAVLAGVRHTALSIPLELARRRLTLHERTW